MAVKSACKGWSLAGHALVLPRDLTPDCSARAGGAGCSQSAFLAALLLSCCLGLLGSKEGLDSYGLGDQVGLQ